MKKISLFLYQKKDIDLGNRGFYKNIKTSIFILKKTIIYLLKIKIKNITKIVKKYFIFLWSLEGKIKKY